MLVYQFRHFPTRDWEGVSIIACGEQRCIGSPGVLGCVFGGEAALLSEVGSDGVVSLLDGYVEGGHAVVGEGVDVGVVGQEELDACSLMSART